MKYKVRWKPITEEELAAIWLSASNRQGVTEAAAQLDTLLTNNRLQVGESRASSVQKIAYQFLWVLSMKSSWTMRW